MTARPGRDPGRDDVALVFTPIWYYPHPPHELATLTGYLRAKGRRVSAFDLNLDAALHLLSDAFLTNVLSRLRDEWDALCARERLTDADAERIVLLAKVLTAGAHAVPVVPGALRVMRSDAFYDLARHKAAVRVLHQVWELVSVAHAPAQVGLGWFRTNLYDEETLQGCLDAATDPSCNPYVEYVRSSAVPRLLAGDPRCVAMVYVHPDQLVPMLTTVVALRAAGYDGHVTVTGNLEDQVTFGRYLQHGGRGALDGLAAYIDSVVMYDAEEAVDALAGSVVGRRCPVEDIPNVGFFRGNRFVGPSRFTVTDLDAVPTPDYDDLDLDSYLFPERSIALLGSRGCYWDRCTFCAITTNHLRFRHRPAGRVVDDLVRLTERHGIRWVHFRDMLFSPVQARRISAEILDRDLRVRWTCRARFEEAFTSELLAAMARAGCVQIWFGLESATQRVLDLMDKGTRIESARRIIADCRAVGIGVHALVMHGFPTETTTEALETVRFLEAHAGAIDSITYTDFILFAGTPVHSDPGRFDVALREQPEKPLRHAVEHHDTSPAPRVPGAYDVLKSRLDDTFGTGLLHLAHVALIRDRHGPRPWPPHTATEHRADQDGWQAQTAWLGATWDIADLSGAPGHRPRRRNCLLVSQAGSTGFVQVDYSEAAGEAALGWGTIDDLIAVMVGSEIGPGDRPDSIRVGVRALAEAGFLDDPDVGAAVARASGSACSS